MCSGQVKKKNLNILCFSLTFRSSCCCFFCCESSQTYLKFVEQLLQRHLLFRNTLQERLSAEHWKSLVGDILVQLIGQNDVSRCSFFFSVHFFYDFAPRHWTLRELTIALIWVVQTAFSDMYLGYTTTLASFLSLEFSRLNHPENSHKAQVFYSVNIIQPWCINQTSWWIFFPCLPFNRTARWRKRKWNCSPCCWHLCLASTATWATSRWVSSHRGSS